MKITIPNRRSSKSKIELYFVLYITTIVSFLTIESQLKNYIKEQDDVLLEVAQKEIINLVQVKSNSASAKDDSLEISVVFAGDFEKDNFSSNITLYSDAELNPDDLPFEISSELTSIDDSFKTSISYADFGDFLRKPLRSRLKINFVPKISDETENRWVEEFGSEKVVRKIKNNIFKRVKEDGYFSFEKKLETPIVPKVGISETFEIVFDKEEYPVIRDIPYTISFFNTGIDQVEDLILDVVNGKSLVSSIEKNSTKSFLKGIARNSGTITIRGVRTLDDSISTGTMRLKVFNPQWESVNNVYEAFIGETFEFDARIKEIPQGEISVTLTSDLLKNGTVSYNSPFINLEAFNRSGTINLSVFVDGNEVKDLRSALFVKKPPPPEINVTRFNKTNELKITVKIFGKTNAVNRIRRISGIQRIDKNPTIDKQINRTTYTYTATITPPREFAGVEKEVHFEVRDKFKEISVHKKSYDYIPN